MEQAEIGRIIRAGRKAKGFNQSQLAKIMGVTPGTISHWETNNRSIYAHDLIKMANELNIVSDLFPGFVKESEMARGKDWDFDLAKRVAEDEIKLQELEKKIGQLSQKLEKEKGGKKKILVIEDDRLIPLVIKSALMAEGFDYDVVNSPNGLEALNEMAREDSQFSLIILDLLMPGVSGVEFLKLLKNTPIVKDIPIIILTGATQKIVEQAKKFKPEVILRKPFHYENFLKTVKKLGL